jgi:hypothetical protein
MTNPESTYTARAITAVLQATHQEHDFSDWIAQVLATVAAELGSSDALTAGRPGSWEATHVRALVDGTPPMAHHHDPPLGQPPPSTTARRSRHGQKGGDAPANP